MEILREITFVFKENTFLTWVLCLGFAGVLISCIVGYLFKDTGVYTALWIMILALASVALLWGRGGLKTGVTCLSLLAVFGGGAYLALFSAITIRKNVAARRQRRAEATRRLSYALPDRENFYVRSRLQTALNVPQAEEEQSGEKRKCKISHARKLLAKVKEAPLSTAERLEAEDMSRLLALYVQKERWTAEDIRMVNELFSCLLKLSAKYAV